MKVKMFKFELGDKLKEEITGFEGIAVSRCQYLNGCIRYGIQSNKLKADGEVNEIWFDEQSLKRTGPGINKKKVAKTEKHPGGPRRSPPSSCSDPI